MLFGALETMMNVENGEKMERVVRERERESERETHALTLSRSHHSPNQRDEWLKSLCSTQTSHIEKRNVVMLLKS